LPVFCFKRVPALARSPSLVAFVLLQCSPGLHVGNLQAARVAAKPLPRFMYGYAARAAVAAIRAALPVSSAWLGLHFRNVGGIVLQFLPACVCASTVWSLCGLSPDSLTAFALRGTVSLLRNLLAFKKARSLPLG